MDNFSVLLPKLVTPFFVVLILFSAIILLMVRHGIISWRSFLKKDNEEKKEE